MPPEAFPYLVVAISGRALAESAVRGHCSVVVLDCFADRDTCALSRAARSIVAPRSLRFGRRAVLHAAQDLAPPARSAGLVYGSGFEGRPELLSVLARNRRLYGNSPAVVSSVRDPSRLFPLWDQLEIRYPEVRVVPPRDPVGWLVKHPGGAGGAQVRHADHREAKAGEYYQRLQEGRTLSALFLADGRHALLLGLNEQWTSPARPGRPFLYGGAVGGIHLPQALESDLREKLDALVKATGLVGLNGLDFLLYGGEWFALEVNPRPTATVELYDPDYPEGLFAWHLRATVGELPVRAMTAVVSRAHGIVHAPARWQVKDDYAFSPWCRDLPQPATVFAPGDPICTVHAEAPDPTQAVALVRQRQDAIEAALQAEATPALAT